MKTVFRYLVLMTVLFAVTTHAAMGRAIRVGIFPLEPINFFDEHGDAQGINPDLLREIVRDQSDWKLEFVPVNWAEGLSKLQAGEIDLMVSVAHTPERAQTMDYNGSPILEVWGQAFVSYSTAIEHISELNRKKIGIMRKDLSGDNFIQLSKNFGISCEISEYASHEDVFKAVQSGEVYAGIAPHHFGLRHAHLYDLKGSPVQFSPFPIYFASKKGRQQELLAEIDFHLGRWKNDRKSYYYDRLDYWLNASYPGHRQIPFWVWIAGGVIGGIAALLFGINRVLKHQVNRRTAELRAAENYTRTIFNSVQDALVVHHPETGGILDFNATAEKMFGICREQLGTITVGDLSDGSPDFMQQEGTELIRRSVEGRPQVFEWASKHSDGRVFPTEVSFARAQIGGQPRVIACVRDITERKQAENALKESEEQFRSTVNDLLVGVVVHHADTSIVFSNPQAQKILGLSAEQIASNQAADPAWRFVRPDGSPMAVEEYPVSRVATTGEKLSDLTLGIEHPDREEITWVTINGIPVFDEHKNLLRIIINFIDITDQKRAQERLLYEKYLLSKSQEMGHIGTWQLDIEKNELVWTDEACRIFGSPEGTVTNYAHFINAVHPDDRDTVHREWAAAIEGKPYDIEHRILRDGKTLWICEKADIERDDTGRAIRAIGFAQDITERKEAERKLLESEERYRLVFATAGDAMFLLDQADGTILESNEAASAIYGYSPDELRQLKNTDLSAEPEKTKKAIKEELRFAPVRYHRRKDGSVFPVEIKAGYYDLPGQRVSVVNIRDITERKRAEEIILRERDFSQAALDSLPGLFYLFDDQGRFLRVNKNFEHVSGYSAEELSQMTIQNLFDGTVWPRVETEIQRVFQIGESSVEADFLSKNQTRTPCFFTGKRFQFDEKTCLLGMGIDITERKQAESQKERLLTAINQAAEIVMITDPEGMIEYVNPAFESITGYSRKEAVGKSSRILKSGEHDVVFYQQLWDTLLSGETWSGRIVNKKKDGTIYTEEATISPVKDTTGKIVNYVAVKHDVTEELKMERQLRQAQKMESIGQLVGGVAHDFNNLLQIINGYTDLACSKLARGHAAVANLEEVSKAGLHAKDLVRQLLAFSRQQVIDPVDLDLNEEVESSQKMLARLIGEHIQFRFVAGKDLGPVFADKGQISQVLMNLCVNARDAMPDGGTLTIETKDVSINLEDMAACGLTRPGRYVLLSVADTGCGMDRETCEKIFDPFFTTKEVGKGTGLGLSTVYGIVKQNEGHINVYSEPGNGTVFKIYLPVCTPLPASVISTILEDAVPSEEGIETILVVEDDETLLKLATCFLSDAGYTVLTAKDGEDAVRVFEEHADEIDCIMMDVVMPRMGGKQAMDLILKKRPAVRYLFCSGYSQDAGHNDFIKEKNQHLLSKPYQSETLLRKIREVLDEE